MISEKKYLQVSVLPDYLYDTIIENNGELRGVFDIGDKSANKIKNRLKGRQ